MKISLNVSFHMSYDLLHHPDRNSRPRVRGTGKSCARSTYVTNGPSWFLFRGTDAYKTVTDRARWSTCAKRRAIWPCGSGAHRGLLERCARWILKDTTRERRGGSQQSGIPDARGRPYIPTPRSKGAPPSCPLSPRSATSLTTRGAWLLVRA